MVSPPGRPRYSVVASQSQSGSQYTSRNPATNVAVDDEEPDRQDTSWTLRSGGGAGVAHLWPFVGPSAVTTTLPCA